MHSFEQITSDPRYRAAVAWSGRVGSARMGLSRMNWKAGRMENLGAKYSVLALYHSTTDIRHTIGGEERPVRRFVPGDMMLRPPHLDYATEYSSDMELTVFALDDALVQSVTTAFNANVGEVFARLDVKPFRSPLVEGLGRQLSDHAQKPDGDRLYADALIQAMVHELWRMAGNALDFREAAPGTLPESTMRRINEAIEAAPATQMALERLADTAGMSMTAFANAVKATTGQTPYQYVLSRRVAVAQDLVENTGLTLAEIAFRAGFSSQSHMTDVFRAKVGTTPGRLRAERR